MPELSFDLLLVSPAFLNGAQRGTKTALYMKKTPGGWQPAPPKTVPYYPVDDRGIRIPSLRGVLEFWYRSLLASSENVFKDQGRIFGSVDFGQGLTIRPAGNPKVEGGELVCVEKEIGARIYGLVCMGYGPLQTFMTKDEGRVTSSHNPQQFRDVVKIDEAARTRFRFVARGTEDQIRALKKALILLHLFGGLGARSRRGWGSVEVSADCIQPMKGKDPAIWFREQLAEVWQAEKRPDGTLAPKPRFSAFSEHTRIALTEPIEGRPEKVILDFFERLRQVRSYRQSSIGRNDHDLEMRDARQSGGSVEGVPLRLAFGMPYQPESRTNRWRIEYRGCLPGRAGSEDDEVTRRASPLLLKVLRLGPNRHMGVAVFLAADFFGNPDLQIGAKALGPLGPKPFPGYGAIESFMAPPSKDTWAATFAQGAWKT